MTDRSSHDATASARSDRLPRRLLGLASAIVFVALCFPFKSFVLDDSFITYRYALNLVEHGTLAWNVGRPPVEGFTSLLWVLVNAVGMLATLDPVVTSKLVALASTLAIGAILLREERDAPLGMRAALVAGLACSPALALLTMQGMETATTTLIVLFVAREALACADEVDRRRALRLAALFFLALIARPDTAVFGAGVGATLVVIHAVRRDRAGLLALAMCVTAFVAAVGVYTAWRWWIFGELLPNTYYVKMSADDPLRAALGRQYVVAFLQMYLWPYLALGALAACAGSSRARILRALPVLVGASLFIAYVSGIRPLQGMGGRFLFPVVPALFLAILALADTRRPLTRGLAHPAAWLALIVLSAAWVLQHTPLILDVRRSFSPTDRVAAGRALAGLDGRMFVSESGALPYYSRWTTLDRVGLTSDVIAHGGLTRAVLEDFAPDLIQDIGRTGNYTVNQVNRMQIDYMRDHGFVAIAATRRNERTIHYYFARPASPLFDECVERLRELPGVEQAPLQGQIHVPGLGIHP